MSASSKIYGVSDLLEKWAVEKEDWCNHKGYQELWTKLQDFPITSLAADYEMHTVYDFLKLFALDAVGPTRTLAIIFWPSLNRELPLIVKDADQDFQLPKPGVLDLSRSFRKNDSGSFVITLEPPYDLILYVNACLDDEKWLTTQAQNQILDFSSNNLQGVDLEHIYNLISALETRCVEPKWYVDLRDNQLAPIDRRDLPRSIRIKPRSDEYWIQKIALLKGVAFLDISENAFGSIAAADFLCSLDPEVLKCLVWLRKSCYRTYFWIRVFNRLKDEECKERIVKLTRQTHERAYLLQ